MFKIIHKSKISNARLGLIKTPHGNLETPIFMSDATRGVIKHLSAGDLNNLNLECLVANTLHLFLRPGAKLIKRAKGLHNFMDWQKPILTDSGGYQVFSLIRKNGINGAINDKGAIFKSPLDGAKLKMTPELSIKTQFALGADMIVCFDDCPPNGYNDAELSASVERTIKWAKRCRREYDKLSQPLKNNKKPLLFAVIQGGDNLKLREHCSKELIKIGFDGFGFGARHVDEAGNFLAGALKYTAGQIPENKLRFGLGIGLPEDIIRSVQFGWDMFDCVIPTREGRHGKLFFKKKPLSLKANNFYETINITNAKFSKDFSPINGLSELTELRRYSKAYLNYLFKIGEPLALRLASLNNLEFYLKMINEVKALIKKDKI
ncbi:MAG: tRNA guanosine(34) transglycosylase Tgt [Patescibacteria group bacterium]|nr:tRNA guanosine(34) transglycosylase Tgt [Patescibacteria group bacterium]